MALSSVREQLIGKVKEGPGREAYRAFMEAIPDHLNGEAGNLGPTFHIRLLKGARRLELSKVLLTTRGMATPDGNVIDCGAALVTLEGGMTDDGRPFGVKRRAGKEAPSVHRLQTSYDPTSASFGLSSKGVGERRFDVETIQPGRQGTPVRAKMGDAVLDAVLLPEDGDLTSHVRQCLEPYDKHADKVGVIVAPPDFRRMSDTVDPDYDDEILTMYTDGSQLHGWNEASERHENDSIGSPIPRDANRPNFTIDGTETKVFVEDVIWEVRVALADGTFATIVFADMMPRCAVPQRDPETGETRRDGQPKLWRMENRPLVPVGPKKVLVPTAGVCAHVEPWTLGRQGKKLLEGGAMFSVTSEKYDLRR